MNNNIIYRRANQTDVLKLSILFKQVYIHTYSEEGVSDEFANFLVKHFSPERLQRTITQNPDQIIVAAYNENLIGVAEIEFDKTCPCNNQIAPELSKLYILERFCGQGIGFKLLAEVENIVKSNGYLDLWLWVLISNQRAIAFYERQNYKWIGNALYHMEQNTYENKIMWKQL